MKKDDNGWSHITHYCKYWVPTNDPIEGCSHAKLLGFALKKSFYGRLDDERCINNAEVEIELQIFCAFQDVAEERQMFGQNYLKHP